MYYTYAIIIIIFFFSLLYDIAFSLQRILLFSHWTVHSLFYSSFRILHSLVSDPIYCSNSFTCLPLLPALNLSSVGRAGLERTASSKNGSGRSCVKQHIPYVTPGLILPLIYATAKRPDRRSWNPVNADHCGSWRFRWRISAIRSPFCLAGSRGCKCHWRHSVARGCESSD